MDVESISKNAALVIRYRPQVRLYEWLACSNCSVTTIATLAYFTYQDATLNPHDLPPVNTLCQANYLNAKALRVTT
jgi:hypothetical protein